MTQEEKQLLLKDLCARLPYKVKGQAVSNGEIYRISSIISVSPSGESLLMLDDNNIDFVTLEQTKPYLRPMSSMTEEEKRMLWEELDKDTDILWENLDAPIINTYNCRIYRGNPVYHEIDFLNKNHFDWRGLIPMGLALEAPEGMY